MPVPHVSDPLDALRRVGEQFYKERPVELPGGHKFTLGPLGAAQEAKANARVQEYRAVHFLKAVKVEQLAYAIVEVDGLRFERPTNTDGSFNEQLYDEQVDAKRNILSSWPEGVVTYLFQELCVLMDEVEAVVGDKVKTEMPTDEELLAAASAEEETDEAESADKPDDGPPPTDTA